MPGAASAADGSSSIAAAIRILVGFMARSPLHLERSWGKRVPAILVACTERLSLVHRAFIRERRAASRGTALARRD
jgi:hypothetical protein